MTSLIPLQVHVQLHKGQANILTQRQPYMARIFHLNSLLFYVNIILIMNAISDLSKSIVIYAFGVFQT